MKDIETREDLEFLLDEFYKIAPNDAEIGHHFKDTELKTHLPLIVNFWEKVLFGRQIYFGNPMPVHQMLHSKSPLTFSNFQRWLEIFNNTIDKFFIGKNAENAKLQAEKIARSLYKNLNS